jgi:hypothetical protein
VSTRLSHLLEYARVRQLGDLDGKTFSELAQFRNCGCKTMRELRRVLSGFQVQPKYPAIRCLLVPESLRGMNPLDFPLPKRVEGALRRRGVTRLGDLDGIAISMLRRFLKCKSGTVSALSRFVTLAARNEQVLCAGDFSPGNLPGLLKELERAVSGMPGRDRGVVMLRLGAGRDNRVWAVQEIAQRMRTSASQVSISLFRAWPAIGVAAGPGPAVQLKQLARFCREKVCPLTEPLLAQWMGDGELRRSLNPAFYLRLMRKLEPEIAAWPRGHRPVDTAKGPQRLILRALRDVLKNKAAGLSFKKTFEQIRGRPDMQNLSPKEFLDALEHARRVTVRLREPEEPWVSLNRKRRQAVKRERREMAEA